MKNLTIIRSRQSTDAKNDIMYIEQRFGLNFPDYLVVFLEKYNGAKVKECYFNENHILKIFLQLRKNDLLASIESILEGHQFYGDNLYIPFAIDSGGWDYNVSIHPDTYGQVWVDKFDSGEENPFEFVCNSFEEFINGLTENE